MIESSTSAYFHVNKLPYANMAIVCAEVAASDRSTRTAFTCLSSILLTYRPAAIKTEQIINSTIKFPLCVDLISPFPYINEVVRQTLGHQVKKRNWASISLANGHID